MTLTINDTTMTSDQTTHSDRAHTPDLREGHRLWPHIQSWAEELGLTAPDAITQISEPPNDLNRQQEPSDRHPEREAND